MQRLTFAICKVLKKIATLKFLPHMDNRPAGQQNTDHEIASHFWHGSKIIHQKQPCKPHPSNTTQQMPPIKNHPASTSHQNTANPSSLNPAKCTNQNWYSKPYPSALTQQTPPTKNPVLKKNSELHPERTIQQISSKPNPLKTNQENPNQQQNRQWLPSKRTNGKRTSERSIQRDIVENVGTLPHTHLTSKFSDRY